MTDRINALTVVLDHDIRDDDVKLVVDAVLMIKNVVGVKQNVADIVDYAARERVRYEAKRKLYDAINSAFEK